MILSRLLPAAILSLFVTLAAAPANADGAHGGAAAVYFERASDTVYIVTRDDRRELKADIANGEVREELEAIADVFLADDWESPESYEFQLLDIVDVTGWVAVGTYRNKQGDILNVWVSGAETEEAAMKALDKRAASRGYPTNLDRDSAYLECDACRIP